jgi:4-hydroxybenzoate polyprenyltransferase
MQSQDTTISPTGSSVRDYLRLLRPQEWVKNGFVFVGILFANAWRQPGMLEQVFIAALAFCLVSSAVYVLNDLLDREQDRVHPTKNSRPLAAGTLSTTSAILLVVLLFLVGFGSATFVSNKVLLILLTYTLVNIAYSIRLKHVVVLDVFAIASGFMLRILAGTFGIGIPPSQWLLLCGLMIALFLGFSKRRAELYASGEDMSHRRVLESYHPVFLDKMIVVTATCVILTYSLYTMSSVTIQTHKTDSLIYTVPFVMYGIFRYIYSLHNQSRGTEPAREIFRDPHLLLAIAGWLGVTLWLISRT